MMTRGAGKKRFRILAALLAAFLLTAAFSAFPAQALDDPELSEGVSAILCHNESGAILYQNRQHMQVYAGPAVRLAAALVFAEKAAKDPQRPVTVHKKVTGLANSTMNPGLKSGEILTVYDLLCGMLVANSNDALYALAFDCFDSADDAPALLLAKMNAKARELGMADTLFAELTGEDPKEDGPASVSSPEDVLTLALEVQKSDLLREICALDEYTVSATNKTGARTLLTRNYMLSAKRIPGYTFSYATGLAGQKNRESGSYAVASADFGGKRFTCVVYGAQGDGYEAFRDAATLFTYANKNFSYKRVLDKTTILGEVKVVLSGDSDYVSVAPENSLSVFLPNDIDVASEISVRTEMAFSELTAPVHEGTVVGKVALFYKGEQIGQEDLITTGSLLQSNSRYYMTLFGNFLRSPAFLFILAAVFLFLIGYMLINARVRYLRRQKPASLVFEEDGQGALLPMDEKEEPEAPAARAETQSESAPAPSADKSGAPLAGTSNKPENAGRKEEISSAAGKTAAKPGKKAPESATGKTKEKKTPQTEEEKRENAAQRVRKAEKPEGKAAEGKEKSSGAPKAKKEKESSRVQGFARQEPAASKAAPVIPDEDALLGAAAHTSASGKDGAPAGWEDFSADTERPRKPEQTEKPGNDDYTPEGWGRYSE